MQTDRPRATPGGAGPSRAGDRPARPAPDRAGGAVRRARWARPAAPRRRAPGGRRRRRTRPWPMARRDDRSPGEVARAFFGLYFVYPNLGLAGPFFDGDVRPLKEMAWLAAHDAIRSGVCVRAEFHARLWDHICDEDRRARAAGRYVQDRSLHSVPAVGRPAGRRTPPPAHRRPDDRRRVRAGAARRVGHRAPPAPLDELSTADVRHKHGLLEQRHMAAPPGHEAQHPGPEPQAVPGRWARRCGSSGTSNARPTTTRTRNDERPPTTPPVRPGRSPRRT